MADQCVSEKRPVVRRPASAVRLYEHTPRQEHSTTAGQRVSSNRLPALYTAASLELFDSDGDCGGRGRAQRTLEVSRETNAGLGLTTAAVQLLRVLPQRWRRVPPANTRPTGLSDSSTPPGRCPTHTLSPGRGSPRCGQSVRQRESALPSPVTTPARNAAPLASAARQPPVLYRHTLAPERRTQRSGRPACRSNRPSCFVRRGYRPQLNDGGFPFWPRTNYITSSRTCSTTAAPPASEARPDCSHCLPEATLPLLYGPSPSEGHSAAAATG